MRRRMASDHTSGFAWLAIGLSNFCDLEDGPAQSALFT